MRLIPALLIFLSFITSCQKPSEEETPLPSPIVENTSIIGNWQQTRYTNTFYPPNSTPIEETGICSPGTLQFLFEADSSYSRISGNQTFLPDSGIFSISGNVLSMNGSNATPFQAVSYSGVNNNRFSFTLSEWRNVQLPEYTGLLQVRTVMIFERQ